MATLAAWPSVVDAHETDQFTLPLDKRFVDMGDFLDAVHYRALQDATAEVNAQIAEALKDPDPERRRQRLDSLHRPWRVADAVYRRFNDPFFEFYDIEGALNTNWARGLQPGCISSYCTLDWVYSAAHFPLDPRRLVLTFQSSTFKAYGVYMGTDKFLHFHHLGIMYYECFLKGRSMGLSDEDALARVRAQYVEGPISEWALLGEAVTGVYSNADLVANYMGMRFYQNLTEPVRLKGEIRPPLLVIKNEFYRLNRQVRPESGWFGWFVSDHWNEALNPNLYDISIRSRMSGVLRQRSQRIVDFYTKVDHRPADPEWFARYAVELKTYYGEDYGHAGAPDELVTIANTCWPEYERRRSTDGTAFARSPRAP